MENIVDALKMAFAVFVFVMALTIAFTVFSQAKTTSDFVIYLNDKTNFEEYIEESQNDKKVVGIETIIPLVARYLEHNEFYSVEIQKSNGESIALFDLREEETTLLQAKERLPKELKKLIDAYRDKQFYESYKEEILTGEIYTTENEEIFEAKNTEKTIRITYRLVN